MNEELLPKMQAIIDRDKLPEDHDLCLLANDLEIAMDYEFDPLSIINTWNRAKRCYDEYKR